MALLGSAASVGSRLLLLSSVFSGGLPALEQAGVISRVIGWGLNLVYLALLFVAGILTARRTGGVGWGALAGLLAGGVGALVNGVVALLVPYVVPATLFYHNLPPALRSLINSTPQHPPSASSIVR